MHLAGRGIWQLKEELVEAACSFVVCSVGDTEGYLLAAAKWCVEMSFCQPDNF